MRTKPKPKQPSKRTASRTKSSTPKPVDRKRLYVYKILLRNNTTGNLRSIFDGRLWTLDEWMHEPIDRTKTGYFQRGGLYVFNTLTAAYYPFQNASWWPHKSWGREGRRHYFNQWRHGYSPVVVRCVAKGKDTKKTTDWLSQQKSRYSSVKPIAIIRGSN